jgi:hypothetical protein
MRNRIVLAPLALFVLCRMLLHRRIFTLWIVVLHTARLVCGSGDKCWPRQKLGM